MINEGISITTSAGKANAFMSHYASVSRLSFTKEERGRNRECKSMLRSPSVDGEQCREFTIPELESAINKMKAKGAAGPDDIPPTFLKALGPVAKGHLLAIFNESFSSGFCAQVWRNAIIMPLLKAGKPASQLASYRPVSLTSCVVKTLERMVATRLYCMACAQTEA